MTNLELNLEQFHNYISGEIPVLIEFQAPWCIYCRRITPAMNKLVQQYEGRLQIGQINIDNEPALAEQEQIELVPTLVLYHKGKALGSIVAPESKARIEQFVQEHLSL